MFKSIAAKFALALVLLGAAASANAATVSYPASTIGGPILNRPFAGGSDLSPSDATIPYGVQAFQMDASGSYSFLSTQTGVNGLLFLYSPSFNSTNPHANIVAGNDDLPAIGISRFTSILNAGASYLLVMTGFSISDAGFFTNSTGGDGTITLDHASDIPLPAALPLFFAGLAATAYLGRRSLVDA